MTTPDDLEHLQQRIRSFVAERDWSRFHAPKNLAMALSVEAAELLEIFQWMSETDSRMLDDANRRQAADEVADVFIYLLQMADALKLDPVKEAHRKLTATEARYPVERHRGVAIKADRDTGA